MDIYLQQLKKDLNARNEMNYKEYLKKRFLIFRYICIYGMGEIGQNVYNALWENGFHIDFFCDSDREKVGKEYRGVKCISIEELRKVAEETIIVIASANYYYEIKDFLLKQGMDNIIAVEPEKFRVDQELKYFKGGQNIIKNLESLFEILDDEQSKQIIFQLAREWCMEDFCQERLDSIYSVPQYFPEDLVHLGKEEVYVDCGAFNGDTFEVFLEQVSGNFKKAVLLELNEKTGKVLEESVQNLCCNRKLDRDKVVIHKCGVSNRAQLITYREDSASSAIDTEGVEGYVETLDRIIELDNINPTFIKMDIEGEEVNALKGAQRCIQRDKPVLAICIYHKMEHLWEIPLMIKKMVPEYRIYVRHHTNMYVETVCYALPGRDRI